MNTNIKIKKNEVKRLAIDIAKNGFIVTTSNANEQYVFDNIKKLKKWLEDYVALTDEIRRFNDALDKQPTKSKEEENIENVTSGTSGYISDNINSNITTYNNYKNNNVNIKKEHV